MVIESNQHFLQYVPELDRSPIGTERNGQQNIRGDIDEIQPSRQEKSEDMPRTIDRTGDVLQTLIVGIKDNTRTAGICAQLS